jgi:hypothetical protein
VDKALNEDETLHQTPDKALVERQVRGDFAEDRANERN